MKIFFIFFLQYLFIININSFCPDDEDLQHHKCICNIINSYIQCSSLPNRCRTCYRYKAIYFDENIDILPTKILSFYKLFDNEKKNLFKIQFTQLKNLSIKSFSNIHIKQEQILEIKILKYLSSIIPTQIFENLTIETKGKFHIEIYNITEPILSIKQYAFDGIKFHSQSQFQFSILNAKDSIEFEENAGSIILSSYAYMKLYFTNFIQIFFNKYSFDHIIQQQFSELIISFKNFQLATISHNALSNFYQFNQSYFHLSLLNFQHLNIEQILFNNITQFKSWFIISINNLTNDLCLPNQTFSQIKQENNSTFQFEINYGQNILFASESFNNITQNLQSKFLISISNSYDVYFSRYSLNNIHQIDQSVIDISIKYGQNLIFEDYAINNIDIYRSSVLKIAFQYSRGTLQMAMNAFSNINEGQGGELLFQLMNSSDFYFRFNQSISLQRLEILDRSLSSEDLCRISNIPSHIPVKLLYDNQCSCTIYYLYRHMHQKFVRSILNEFTPLCYSNMSLNEIELEENKCKFENQIYNCQQMEGEIEINIPQEICSQKIFKSSNNSKNIQSISTFICFLFIFGCLIFIIICIYIIYSSSSLNILSKYFNHSQNERLSIFSRNSYQQESKRQIIVKYNSTIEQIQPFLDIDQSNEDAILKLNLNPLNNIEE